MTEVQTELSSLPVLRVSKELVEQQPAEAALSKEERLQKWKKSAERCQSMCVRTLLHHVCVFRPSAYVSAYCCVFYVCSHIYPHTAVSVCVPPHTAAYVLCPHTAECVSLHTTVSVCVFSRVSACCRKCMCPHTAV
jgi:hypothetical protein